MAQRIEEIEFLERGDCPHCGHPMVEAHGLVHDDSDPSNVYHCYYSVGWKRGREVEDGARFDLVLGHMVDLGEECAEDEEIEWPDHGPRILVTAELRWLESGPAFGLMNGRLEQFDWLATKAPPASLVRGTPLAEQMFAYLDFIWAEDARLHALTVGPPPPTSWIDRLRAWMRRSD